MIHNLKINSCYFEYVINKEKAFEIRKNDRNFQVGDYIYLNEWNKEKSTYTGRKVKGKIIYITDYEQKDNYVVFGFDFIEYINKMTSVPGNTTCRRIDKCIKGND